MTAKRIANLIQRNVALWYADVISHTRFSNRQQTLWQIARTQNIDDAVLEIVRPRLKKF